jgi:hypothetical protein
VKAIFEHLARWQIRQVLGDMDAASVEVEVLDRLALLARTG